MFHMRVQNNGNGEVVARVYATELASQSYNRANRGSLERNKCGDADASFWPQERGGWHINSSDIA